ncbi:hypothetical protein RRG08_061638 [Elysia crispata]|uniref:Uncharacterized protein n=1 Tax=Elysia crispata TaxID=231223 RepID=A0AAE1A156_9GAST|nr:hypothetical protein RRG08_061638 [Elysia crispata]
MSLHILHSQLLLHQSSRHVRYPSLRMLADVYSQTCESNPFFVMVQRYEEIKFEGLTQFCMFVSGLISVQLIQNKDVSDGPRTGFIEVPGRGI